MDRVRLFRGPAHLRISSTRLDYRMVAQQARAFIDLVRPTLATLPTNITEPPNVTSSGLTFAACAATLLALGIELHLKAVYIGSQIEPPETHSLIRLFENLPLPQRQDIESRYLSKLATVDPLRALTLNIRIRESKDPPVEWPSDPPFVPPDYSARAVLSRSANAFIAWRYFYEAVPHDRPFLTKVFDHVPLLMLSESLDEFIQANAR